MDQEREMDREWRRVGDAQSWRFAPERREAVATMGVDKRGWLTDLEHAHEGKTSEATAVLCHFVVLVVVAAGGRVYGATEFHGGWRNYGEARRFAAGMGVGVDFSPGRGVAIPLEVEPYWYVRGVGVASQVREVAS